MTQSEEISLENLDALVERHMAFLIRTVSRITGRYVSIENDDEFSIALSAFAEAVRRYEPERGAFLAFAGLVIQSRLCTYLEKEQKQADTISLDSLLEQGQEFPKPEDDSQGQEILKEEISLFSQELSYFHLTLEDLAEHSPKHQDTRERAISIAERSSQEPSVVNTTYRKKKLPMPLPWKKEAASSGSKRKTGCLWAILSMCFRKISTIRRTPVLVSLDRAQRKHYYFFHPFRKVHCSRLPPLPPC